MKIQSLAAAISLAALSTSASATFTSINNGDVLDTDVVDLQVANDGIGVNQGYVTGRDFPRTSGLPQLDPPAENQFGEAGEEEFFTQWTVGYERPAGFEVIAENEYEIEFPEDGELEEIGIMTDQVWRKTDGTGTLTFATRVTLFPELGIDDEEFLDEAETQPNPTFGETVFLYEGEFNEIRRDYGSFSTAVGFFVQSLEDRNPDEVSKVDNVVTFVNDMSGEEENPYSVWHLVHTDATEYAEREGALILFSEEDEDEGRFEDFFFGEGELAFVPVPVPAALPLLASALGALGFFSRRRG